jgi:hypothetical protein
MGRSDDSTSTQLRQTETAIGLPKELETRKTGVVLTPFFTFRSHTDIIMAPDNRQSKVKQRKEKQRKGKPKQNQRKKEVVLLLLLKAKRAKRLRKEWGVSAQRAKAFCASDAERLRKDFGAIGQWGEGVVRSSLRAITFAPKLRCAPF